MKGKLIPAIFVALTIIPCSVWAVRLADPGDAPPEAIHVGFSTESNAAVNLLQDGVVVATAPCTIEVIEPLVILQIEGGKKIRIENNGIDQKWIITPRKPANILSGILQIVGGLGLLGGGIYLIDFAGKQTDTSKMYAPVFLGIILGIGGVVAEVGGVGNLIPKRAQAKQY